MIRTHYDVLGVARDADAPTIRAAYRARARTHHPDRTAGATASEMAAINEAYRVLSDAARRVDYDRMLRADGAPTTSSAAPTPSATSSRVTTARSARRTGATIYDGSLPPARVPWRFLMVMLGAGIGLVLAASVLSSPGEPRPPDGVLRPGSCAAIEPNGDAVEVRCTVEADLVVERLVPTGERCPTGTVGHRDRLGLGTACLRTEASS